MDASFDSRADPPGGLARRLLAAPRQRAGLALGLAVVLLHAWLLAQWSGLAAAGTARAWPSTVVQPAVMRVASVQMAALRSPAAQADEAQSRAAAVAVQAAATSSRLRPAAGPRRIASGESAATNEAAATTAPPTNLGSTSAAAKTPAKAPTTAPTTAPITAQSPADANEPADEPSLARGAEGSLPNAPLPLYATRMPAPSLLRYALQLNGRRGLAELDWQHDGQQYRLQLSAAAPGGPTWQQASSGAFDAAGLAPQRFVDRRGRRGERAANFEREAGRIRFSGSAIEYPLLDGAQDRLGFIVQLAAIASAAGAASAANASSATSTNSTTSAAAQLPPQISLFVVDARGLGDVWTFVNQGLVNLESPLGTVPTVYLLRQNQRLNDWRVEVWLDPQRGFWPARLRMTVARSGAVFELNLADLPQPQPQPR